jgi:hypothetical protein
MKHHFADELERKHGQWSITPNRLRWANHFDSLDDAPADISALTLTRADKGWERSLSFRQLRELTLDNPSPDQLEAIPHFSKLRALRITHGRPKSLAMLEKQWGLRELVLEYVSNVNDLAILGELPNLTALHIENMRNTSDFSPLGQSASIRYLSIDGTLDWKQPIDSLEFLVSMSAIELLRLKKVRVPDTDNPLGSLLKSKTLRWLDLAMDILPLAEYARLEAALPHVDGAKRPAFIKYGGEDRELSRRDIRYRMPLDQFSTYRNLYIAEDGRRFERVPHQAALLGKGERWVTGEKHVVEAKCDAHRHKYDGLVDAMRAPHSK